MNRHEAILELLQQKQDLEVNELQDKLDVSAVTIRKDLNQLAKKGLLFRTRGGATLRNIYTLDRSVNEKENVHQDEKIAIAKKADELIEEYHSVIIASGTTVLNLARFLREKEQLTAVTNSVQVAMALAHKQGVHVIQLGGELRRSSFSATGYYAEQALKEMTCELLFLGVDGIDINHGLTTTSLGEAWLNKQMITSSESVIVLADSSKFGRKGFGRICGFNQVNTIVTDQGIEAETQHYLEQLDIQVLIASP